MNQKITIWMCAYYNQSGGSTATTMFATSDETFSVSQTLSVSSSKVKDIEEESPTGKKVFLGIALMM